MLIYIPSRSLLCILLGNTVITFNELKVLINIFIATRHSKISFYKAYKTFISNETKCVTISSILDKTSDFLVKKRPSERPSWPKTAHLGPKPHILQGTTFQY